MFFRVFVSQLVLNAITAPTSQQDETQPFILYSKSNRYQILSVVVFITATLH
jgi:hypothetical protein